jgi:hypothetical protein
MNGPLSDISKLRDARSARTSSWDHSGKNTDYWTIPPNESIVIADIDGPGSIQHIWMTQFCQRAKGPAIVDPETNANTAPVNEIPNPLGITWEEHDPDFFRKVLIKMYWDDNDDPSVLVPLGDFFCIGHSLPSTVSSLPFTVSVKPEEEHTFGGQASVNCWLPMPFDKNARIEIENQNDVPYGQYFYIDHELYNTRHDDDVGYFHAQWQRENPCDGWGPNVQVNSPEVNNVENTTSDGNYTILDTEGRGHYIGCNLSVAHFQDTWWGEGDDMIFIDGEEWPPSIHGTGAEDYFGHAWGMQDHDFPMHGTAVHENDMPGYQVSYRFHLTDPVHFSESIEVTMEHGHANHLSDDWASTAYWYQSNPSNSLSILPVDERIPTHPEDFPSKPQAPADPTDAQQQALENYNSRTKKYIAKRDETLEQAISRTREQEKLNRDQASRIRKRFEEE